MSVDNRLCLLTTRTVTSQLVNNKSLLHQLCIVDWKINNKPLWQNMASVQEKVQTGNSLLKSRVLITDR